MGIWETKTDLEKLRAFYAIVPCSATTQEEWAHTAWAARNIGGELSEFDVWSAADTRRYKGPGDCKKVWNRPNNSGGRLGAGTLLDIADAHGMKKRLLAYYDGETASETSGYEKLDWESALPPTGTAAGQTAAPTQKNGIEEPGEDWNGAEDLRRYLKAVFRPGDKICYCVESNDGHPVGKGICRTFEKLDGDLVRYREKNPPEDALEMALNSWDKSAGAWIRINPFRNGDGTNSDVADWRHTLIECDGMPVEEQLARYKALDLPCAAIVHSGGKSIHAIVKIEASSSREYSERVERLYGICKAHGLEIDTQNKNPSRYSRLPGVTRGGRKQFLIATDCGAASWDKWLEWLEAQNVTDAESIDTVSTEELKATAEYTLPMIDGVLEEKGKMLIVAASKSRKSFFALQMAVCLANGIPFLGCDIQRPYRTLYVNFEIKDKNFCGRIETMLDRLNASGKLLRTVRRDACRKITVANLKAAIRRDKIECVIIDPIYFMLRNENDQEEVKAFCESLDALCLECGCTLIAVHHAPKGIAGDRQGIDLAAGSGVLARFQDAVIPIVKHKDYDEERQLYCIGFELRDFQPKKDIVLEFADGVFVERQDIEAQKMTSATIQAKSRRQQQERIIVGQEQIAAIFQASEDGIAGEINRGTLTEGLRELGVSKRNIEPTIADLKRKRVIDERQGERNTRLFSLSRPENEKLDF